MEAAGWELLGGVNKDGQTLAGTQEQGLLIPLH